MPELPEVETMRRGIATIVGSRIVAVERCRLPAPAHPAYAGRRSFDRRLVGRRRSRSSGWANGSLCGSTTAVR